MAEGRSRAAWNHTASIMSLLANINRDPRRRSQPYKPDDFTPHVSRKIAPVPVKQVDMKTLKNMYLGMGIPVRTIKAEDIKVRKRADG